MSTAVLPTFVTEEEYLTNPRYKHCEYVDRRVTPASLILDVDGYLTEEEESQNVVTARHATIQFLLSFHLGKFLEAHPIGWGATDLHCVIRLKDGGDIRFRMCCRKMEEYLDAGSRLGWLVLPSEETIVEFRPGGNTQAMGLGERVDGGNGLPGF